MSLMAEIPANRTSYADKVRENSGGYSCRQKPYRSIGVAGRIGNHVAGQPHRDGPVCAARRHVGDADPARLFEISAKQRPRLDRFAASFDGRADPDRLGLDRDDSSLEVAKRFGATAMINSTDGTAVAQILAMTSNSGVATALEAVGVPATFEMCEQIVAPGGVIANGFHGEPVTLYLETLWDRNIAITTRLAIPRARSCCARSWDRRRSIRLR
ncbi:zinc-binding dehydrogenase [Sphingomonas sp. PB2P12]|uniref:zinc-binding dehydrogenase n=1 Tax=Sphingomonas sandaracina TaxID=3096157 RepID=UPI003FA71805